MEIVFVYLHENSHTHTHIMYMCNYCAYILAYTTAHSDLDLNWS